MPFEVSCVSRYAYFVWIHASLQFPWMSEGVTQLHDHALACNLSRFPLYAGLISSINLKK